MSTDKKVDVIIDDKAGLNYGGKYYANGQELSILESEYKTFSEHNLVKLKTGSQIKNDATTGNRTVTGSITRGAETGNND